MLKKESETTCPTGMRLIDSDFSEVAAAFHGFVMPTHESGFVKRGGQPHVYPRTPRSTWPKADRVESTFTPPQQNYNRATIAALTSLACGRPLVRTEHPVKPLAAQVIDGFFAQPPQRAVFAKATTDSIVGLYETFGRLHPNLTPSLRAMTRAGLIGGMSIAQHDIIRMLDNSIRLKADTPQDTLAAVRGRLAHLQPDTPAHHFTEPHASPIDPNISMQVWCPAMVLAQTILKQTSAAAAEIAHSPDLRTPYKVLDEIKYDARHPLDTSLCQVIESSVVQAQAEYFQGRPVIPIQ